MARKQRKLKARYSLAIIGEGITEWHYIDDLRRNLGFGFKVSPELPKHSSYKYIFSDAKKLVNQGYDSVFCVLDVDNIKCNKKENHKYCQAKKSLLRNKKIKIFESMPCIEYWFLIHFINYSTKIYPTYDSLKKKLREFLSDYEKSEKYYRKVRLYSTLVEKGDLEKATKSTILLEKAKLNEENTLFPYSDVAELIKSLKALKAKKV